MVLSGGIPSRNLAIQPSPSGPQIPEEKVMEYWGTLTELIFSIVFLQQRQPKRFQVAKSRGTNKTGNPTHKGNLTKAKTKSRLWTTETFSVSLSRAHSLKHAFCGGDDATLRGLNPQWGESLALGCSLYCSVDSVH